MAPQEASYLSKASLTERWMDHLAKRDQRTRRRFYQDEPEAAINTSALFLISETNSPTNPFTVTPGSALDELTHVSDKFIHDTRVYGQCYFPAVTAVPVDMVCDDISFIREKQDAMFNINTRSCFYGTPEYNTDIQEASNLSAVVKKTDTGIMTVPSSGYGSSLMKVPCKYKTHPQLIQVTKVYEQP